MHTAETGWEQFWLAGGARSASPQLWSQLLLAWSEPHRRYHGLQHLGECLQHLEACWTLAERPAELALALCFHDAIHDPQAPGNEARSAAWAAQAMQEGGFAADSCRRVERLILLTRHAPSTSPVATDEALMLDIDLAILGATPARFAEYADQIRAEYAWVEEGAYRSVRSRLLGDFLGRPQIYRSGFFHAALETAARRNLQAALAALQTAPEHEG